MFFTKYKKYLTISKMLITDINYTFSVSAW